MIPKNQKLLPPFVSIWFQVLFTPLLRVLFTFPSRYWYTIGHRGVFSLTRWSGQIPTGFLESRGTQDTSLLLQDFAYRAITFFGRPFQCRSAIHRQNYRSPTTPKCMHLGLGCSHFARRYSGNRIRFLFLQVLRCFTSLGLHSLRNNSALPLLGYPIRRPPGQSLLPTNRGLSQVAASFIASLCQGIHHMLLVTYRKKFWVVTRFTRRY